MTFSEQGLSIVRTFLRHAPARTREASKRTLLLILLLP